MLYPPHNVTIYKKILCPFLICKKVSKHYMLLQAILKRYVFEMGKGVGITIKFRFNPHPVQCKKSSLKRFLGRSLTITKLEGCIYVLRTKD